MQVKRHTVSITTDASGDASVKAQGAMGIFLQMRYVPDGSSPLATGANLAITEDKSGYNLLTMAAIGTSAFERVSRQTVANADDGVETTTLDYIVLADDATVTIDSGGNSLSGTFYLYFGVD